MQNDPKGEQFCFALFLEQVIPEDTPDHLADSCLVFLEKVVLRLGFTSPLSNDVFAGRDQVIDVSVVDATAAANIIANNGFSLSQEWQVFYEAVCFSRMVGPVVSH